MHGTNAPDHTHTSFAVPRVAVLTQPPRCLLPPRRHAAMLQDQRVRLGLCAVRARHDAHQPGHQRLRARRGEANFSRAYTKVGASHRPPATVQPRGGCPLPSRPHPCERAVHSPMPACPRPVEGRTRGSVWGALAWTTVNPMPMRRHRCRGCGVAVRITAAWWCCTPPSLRWTPAGSTPTPASPSSSPSGRSPTPGSRPPSTSPLPTSTPLARHVTARAMPSRHDSEDA